MEALLTIAVVVTALAVLTQAGVLVAMYLMSRRLTNNVNRLVEDGRRIMEPLDSVTADLKAATQDLAEIGNTAREQMHRVEAMISETRSAFFEELDDARSRFNSTIDEARDTIVAPIREWAAITKGIAAGLRTLFYGRQVPRKQEFSERQRPAA